MDERLFATVFDDVGTWDTGLLGDELLLDELFAEVDAKPPRRSPAWRRDALCREPHPGVTWFPERGEDARPAQAVCRRCLVIEECRAYAGDDVELQGIWGGLSQRQRQRLHRGDPTLDLDKVQPVRQPKPAPVPRPPAAHGSDRCYQNGCRCKTCREAKSVRNAEYRRRARAKLKAAS